MEKVRSFIKKMSELIIRPEMRILPGQIAFFFVVSLIPLIALLGSIASNISTATEAMSSLIEELMPAGIGDYLLNAISSNNLNFNINAFFISAFILASNGTHSMINASNEIYKIKPKDYIRRRLKAIIMIIVLVILLTFLLLVPVFGDSIFNLIKEQITNEFALNLIYKIYQFAKYPISIIIIFCNIKLIYVIAPDDKIESKTTTKGSVFTTISWIISSEIYSIYVEKFTKYDIFYGSISNILVLLLWVYLLAYIFVLGMVINAGDYKSKKQQLKKA